MKSLLDQLMNRTKSTKKFSIINFCLFLFFFGHLIDVYTDFDKYIDQRNAWLLKDEKNNFSANAKLNALEKQVDIYLKALCSHHQYHFLESNDFAPTKPFVEIKSEIEKSPLFHLLKRMPKGGVLHIHADSTGEARWLIERALQETCCYVNIGNDSILKGTLRIIHTNPIPEGFKPLQEIVNQDPDFLTYLESLIKMNTSDTLNANPWEKFNACFSRIEDLFYFEPVFRDYYLHAFETLIEDHIQFVELRTSLDPIRDRLGKTHSGNEVIEIYRSILKEVQQKVPNFYLKLIISDPRSQNLHEQFHSLQRAYQLRFNHPEIIAGYDLVGYETTGHSLIDYTPNLLTTAMVWKQTHRIQLPYYFHAGESGWGNDKNLYEAILLKSQRIGHALNLFRVPSLIDQVKQQQICLEICPISNQVLGYVKDLRLHPAVGYLRQGLPCVLSSDDPMIFGNSGLSYDFWEAIMAWDLSLSDIKQLCLNSIHYSSLDQKEKNQILQEWGKEWSLFINVIVKEMESADKSHKKN